jgi:hypothetical protein
MDFHETREILNIFFTLTKHTIILLIISIGLFFISIFSMFSVSYENLIYLLDKNYLNFIPLLSLKLLVSSMLLIAILILLLFIRLRCFTIGMNILFRGKTIKRWGKKYEDALKILNIQDISSKQKKIKKWSDEMIEDHVFISRCPEFAAPSPYIASNIFKHRIDKLLKTIREFKGT